MSNEEVNESPQRNIWHLVLGILFLFYGSFRLYTLLNSVQTDNLGIALAIGFILFGFYDLYKYYKGV
ncbi:hypothetical protein [Christiangramia aquimixticola]|uniref:hypothetical protein n=1 Tax=Christiangramia aquimixticola TaxID=1697558 RepID=UPI003AA9CD22